MIDRGRQLFGCITVGAAVDAGIVDTNISTIHAPAGWSLTPIFSGFDRLAGYLLDLDRIDTGSMPDAVSFQIDRLGACEELQMTGCRNL